MCFISCKKDEPKVNEKLNLLAFFPLSIHETSGLSAFEGKNRFLTVSDTTGEVYVISDEGILEKTLPFNGGNLEGVCYDKDSSWIYLVDENKSKVICIDTMGNLKTDFEIVVDRLFDKHGLEGIAINKQKQRFYVINEQSPGRLYTLDLEGMKLDSTELNFAEDYSGLCYDAFQDQIWILSDQSKTLSRCSLKGEALQSWDTGVKNGEGLVVNSQAHLVYIVTDSQSSFYSFSY